MNDWQWVLGQREGRTYWGGPRLCFRRSGWPTFNVTKGQVFPNNDGSPPYIAKEDYIKSWHIWELDSGTFCKDFQEWGQGWGEQMGAMIEEDDFVLVNGEKKYDGRVYS